MKRIFALAVVALASQVVLTTYAGEPVESKKEVAPPPIQPAPAPELYRAHEWDVDIFGSYAPSSSDAGKYLGNHAWGGGVGVNYFFTRNFGLGLEGDVLRPTGAGINHDPAGQFALNLLARLPIGETGWAPYAIGGIGGFLPGGSYNYFTALQRTFRDSNSEDILFEGHLGLGVEYRFTPNIGVFTDGRYEWVQNGHDDFAQIRTGIRFAF
jgi:opacity protein-like surface antigen